MKLSRSFLRSFSRSQVSSFVATCVDFGLLFLLTEVFHVYYVISVAIGAFSGAVVNFTLNRIWSFDATHTHWRHQIGRYALVSGGSLALNTGGTYAVTEGFHVPYGYSVALVSLFVGFLFNYPLQRYFVFKARASA